MSSGIDMSFVIGKAKPGDASPEPVDSGQLFRVLLVGDFSGRASRRTQGLAAPTFMPKVIDLDRFDQVFKHFSPSLDLALAGSSEPSVRIGLNSLEDFEPDSLYARLPLFAQLRDLRRRLADPASFEQAAAEMRAGDAAAAVSSGRDAAPAPAPVATEAEAEDDSATLERLLGAAPAAAPVVAAAPASTVDGAVDRLLRSVVAPFVVPATSHLQQPMIDSVDRAVSETMRVVLGNPYWRSLEGNWRAVDDFIRSVEMDGQVLLEMVDASAADVLESLANAQGDVASTALAKSLAARRQHAGEEEGYALVVAMYEFGPSAAELALLAGLGALAASEGAVLIGSAAVAMALVDSPDVWDGAYQQPVDGEAQARWRAMSKSWVAPHIGLVWPSVLSRLPYGAKTQPVAAFAFEEVTDASDAAQLPWRLAALDLAGLLARAYTDSGWDMRSESAVELEDLPAFIDRSGDPPRLQAVAEMFMTERQAQAVAACGVMPLISHRSLPHARLGTWRSIGSAEPELKTRWAA